MFDELKKFGKRMQLASNKMKGQMAEGNFVMQESMKGNKVERTGRGHDFKVTEGPFAMIGRKGTPKSHYVEVKSSPTARLSKLQKETKKKDPNKYEVWRQSF